MSATRTLNKKSEKSPLMGDDFCDHVSKAYGMEHHCKHVPCLYGVAEVITDYEPLKLSSFRVMFALGGTVFQDPIIVIEQVIITLIFGICAITVYICFNQKASDVADGDVMERHVDKAMPSEWDSIALMQYTMNATLMQHSHSGAPSMRRWLATQEARMREFAMIMTVLASLLLSFYTAMAVGRWWAIRTGGVGGIKAAAVELEMMISQLVTQEPQVLGAIRRYARVSLILIFQWRRKRLTPALIQSSLKVDLVQQGLLTPDEADALARWKFNHCMHETIWAWQTMIVCVLWQERKIKSDQLFRSLLEKCSDGRKAIQVIHTHLAVKIPMQYVHLLGLLVKMHNLVLAVIMGCLFGAALRNAETIICVQLAGRTLLLPLLFNAILLINAELSDPFDGHPTDFPGQAYQTTLEKDGCAFVSASKNMPNWMAARNPMPV